MNLSKNNNKVKLERMCLSFSVSKLIKTNNRMDGNLIRIDDNNRNYRGDIKLALNFFIVRS